VALSRAGGSAEGVSIAPLISNTLWKFDRFAGVDLSI
jgi:hypothetical protein